MARAKIRKLVWRIFRSRRGAFHQYGRWFISPTTGRRTWDALGQVDRSAPRGRWRVVSPVAGKKGTADTFREAKRLAEDFVRGSAAF